MPIDLIRGVSQSVLVVLLGLATVNAQGDLEEVDRVNSCKNGTVQSKSIFTFVPGTKWCGEGNRAEHYDDLGWFRAADSCCRDHDHCPDSIGPGDTGHGLLNSGTYTRSHCDCDCSFRRCLKNARSLVATYVGLLYFNILGPRCFEYEHPQTGCAKYSRFPVVRCVQYAVNKSEEKTWQWFDNPPYVIFIRLTERGKQSSQKPTGVDLAETPGSHLKTFTSPAVQWQTQGGCLEIATHFWWTLLNVSTVQQWSAIE